MSFGGRVVKPMRSRYVEMENRRRSGGSRSEWQESAGGTVAEAEVVTKAERDPEHQAHREGAQHRCVAPRHLSAITVNK